MLTRSKIELTKLKDWLLLIIHLEESERDVDSPSAVESCFSRSERRWLLPLLPGPSPAPRSPSWLRSEEVYHPARRSHPGTPVQKIINRRQKVHELFYGRRQGYNSGLFYVEMSSWTIKPVSADLL